MKTSETNTALLDPKDAKRIDFMRSNIQDHGTRGNTNRWHYPEKPELTKKVAIKDYRDDLWGATNEELELAADKLLADAENNDILNDVERTADAIEAITDEDHPDYDALGSLAIGYSGQDGLDSEFVIHSAGLRREPVNVINDYNGNSGDDEPRDATPTNRYGMSIKTRP